MIAFQVQWLILKHLDKNHLENFLIFFKNVSKTFVKTWKTKKLGDDLTIIFEVFVFFCDFNLAVVYST